MKPNWVTAVLAGGSTEYTITLPGGDYLFLLNASGGLALATTYTLDIKADHNLRRRQPERVDQRKSVGQ